MMHVNNVFGFYRGGARGGARGDRRGKYRRGGDKKGESGLILQFNKQRLSVFPSSFKTDVIEVKIASDRRLRTTVEFIQSSFSESTA